MLIHVHNFDIDSRPAIIGINNKGVISVVDVSGGGLYG